MNSEVALCAALENRTPRRRKKCVRREGTTIVEVAFVLPVFFLFLFFLFEYGHAQMINNLLSNATRSGARLGSIEGVSLAEIENRVLDVMAAGIDRDKVTVIIKDASAYDETGDIPTTAEEFDAMPDLDIENAQARQLFLVRATVDYEDVSIIPMSWMKDVLLSGQSFTRHE
jgi:Flp pilus assembly protein TadG